MVYYPICNRVNKPKLNQTKQMESIKIENQKLVLNRLNQIYNNKPIIYSACSMNAQIPAKWIDGTFKHHWVYSFKYIDDDTFVHFEFDYNNQYIGKV